MSEKEVLYQILNREISNFLSKINPAFRMFSSTLTNYVIDFVEPYVNAFTNSDGNINTKAASGYLKEEVSDKIEAFMKKFEAEKDNGSNK